MNQAGSRTYIRYGTVTDSTSARSPEIRMGAVCHHDLVVRLIRSAILAVKARLSAVTSSPLLYLPGPGSNASPQGGAAKSRAPRNGPGRPGRDSAAAAG